MMTFAWIGAMVALAAAVGLAALGVAAVIAANTAREDGRRRRNELDGKAEAGRDLVSMSHWMGENVSARMALQAAGEQLRDYGKCDGDRVRERWRALMSDKNPG